MNLAWLKTRIAWQPLTFDGVAAFATASLKRLLLVQFIFALLAASTVVWFLDNCWFPTITHAILQMPEKGEIRAGQLNWQEEAPQLLADGRFLGIIADLKHTGEIRIPAHIQVELGRGEVRFVSLLGFMDVRYANTNWILACNRTELQPWWGAWQPPILWMTFGAVASGLMLTWAILASAYFLPVWLVGFFANRRVSLWGSWKLAGAALLPGSLLMTVAILFYGFGFLDMVQLAAATATHFALSWAYCIGSPFFEPKLTTPEVVQKNPFETPIVSTKVAITAEKEDAAPNITSK